jgi:hypothetical protein
MNPTTTIQFSTWRQIQCVFQHGYIHSVYYQGTFRWLRLASQTALHRSFNDLRSALSDTPLQQWGVPSPHVFPALYFACDTLNVSQVLHSANLGLSHPVNSSYRFCEFTPSSLRCAIQWINSFWTLAMFWISIIGDF